MRVVGTAGHVDHGKSALVEALTGTHPDRLLEEQRREMTIDLGFAWMRLPDGQDVGIVDVPGHKDFMDNMLAGIGAIEAVILVVAADEGVMPQTREHLQIIDLLGIEKGLVALSKTDLVETEWQDLVVADVRRVAKGTTLEDCPIVRVSSTRREGIVELREALGALLTSAVRRPDLGRPRLSVDRVFHMGGFGTVVTGTLVDGELSIGDEVVILPRGMAARIRGLQSHRAQVAVASPGSRTAANLSGVTVSDLARGDVVTRPGAYVPTERLDVRLRLVEGTEPPLRDHEEVKVYLGAARVIGRARMLERDAVPSESAWVRLELDSPLVAVRGDRVIVRRPSPAETLGGGVVIDPLPTMRARRGDAAFLRRLEGLLRGTPSDVVLQSLTGKSVMAWRDAWMSSHLDEQAFASGVRDLIGQGEVLNLGVSLQAMDRYLVAGSDWRALTDAARGYLTAFHQSAPLRLGMPRNELRSRLGLEPRVFQACLERWCGDETLEDASGCVCMAGHSVRLSPEQEAASASVMRRLRETPFSPPSRAEIAAMTGPDLLDHLIESGQLVSVGQDVLFEQSALARMEGLLREALAVRGRLTIAEVRDVLGSSRKYVLAFLEEMDRRGVTVRDGDYRRLKS